MDRQTWLEARRKGVGGSDAAAILGLSRFRTAIDVYEDKLGLSAERPQTAPMRWGLALEDAISDAYVEETGRRVRKSGIRRARHVRAFPMIGSLDRLADGRVVELKTARSDSGFGDRDGWRDLPPERRVPPDYYVQVQHYMEVVQYDVADVAVLFGGSDFRVYEIPFDRVFVEDLLEEERLFWTENVLAGVYPPAGADDLDHLNRRWTSTDDERVATSEETLLLDAFLRAVREVETAERNRDGLRAELEEKMGAVGKLIAPGATVSWRSHDRTTVKWKEYASILEEVLARVRMHPHGAVGSFVDSILSEGLGTTDLADVRGLYSATSSVRPFRVDRKEGVTE